MTSERPKIKRSGSFTPGNYKKSKPNRHFAIMASSRYRIRNFFWGKMNGSMCFERLPQVLSLPTSAGSGLGRSLNLNRACF
ncbi:MAG: hypothetical protein D6714_08460 [Bacteroidetes bacterium]|nr:MAG: hypothetical protein D6714_08460 [Bacteroidota bacterium]